MAYIKNTSTRAASLHISSVLGSYLYHTAIMLRYYFCFLLSIWLEIWKQSCFMGLLMTVNSQLGFIIRNLINLRDYLQRHGTKNSGNLNTPLLTMLLCHKQYKMGRKSNTEIRNWTDCCFYCLFNKHYLYKAI